MADNENFFQAVVTKQGRDALDAKDVDWRDLSQAEVRDHGRVAIKEKVRKRAIAGAIVGVIACVSVLEGIKLGEQDATQPAAHGQGNTPTETRPAGTASSLEQFRNEAVIISQKLGDQDLPKGGVIIHPGDLK